MKTSSIQSLKGAQNPSIVEETNIEMPVSTSSSVTSASIIESSPAPSMSLESVCHYAIHMTDDHDSNIIVQMMMAQYMQQGLQHPELAQEILGIPERRKQLQRDEAYKRLHPGGTLHTSHLPPALRTPAAIDIWQRLFSEALVDEDCQTLCSRTESGLMAAHISKALGIRNVWVTFEELWGIRNLKSSRDKAFDYQNGWNFQKKLDSLITY